MKKIIGSLAVCAAIVLSALPSISFSQQNQRQAKRDRLHGLGGFTAKGQGQAIVKGDGKIQVDGRGTVVIRASRRDDIDARGFGFRRQDGNLFYFEGRGHIEVKGTNISLDITGDVDELKAAGNGTARLIGVGHFKSARDNGNWIGGGIDVVYGRR
ncbi:MAG: hypothetical protein H7Y17_05030 [Chlorobia bacterium]|nr:hypothetical protein [Fimbriimonadaceae bacterium]